MVDCTAPENIADAATKLLSNPETLESMGQAGREHVENRFSWETLASNAKKLFS